MKGQASNRTSFLFEHQVSRSAGQPLWLDCGVSSKLRFQDELSLRVSYVSLHFLFLLKVFIEFVTVLLLLYVF